MSEILSSTSILKPGPPAPNFTLQSTPDQSIVLSQFRGHPTILAFYPADFSPVCGDQMILYNEILPEFQRFNAELIGISEDGVWCHLAFPKDRNSIPILSDFEPQG
ncbi:MAG: redoxin domain-containing protein [Nitrososphaeraceae archaeon]